MHGIYYNKNFLRYQPRGVVKWRKNQCFEDRDGPRNFISPFNHLTRLVARENFIILSRRESSRS
jgi:hypothetical protein